MRPRCPLLHPRNPTVLALTPTRTTRARSPRPGPTSSLSSKPRWKGRWWIWRSCGGSRARACPTTLACGLSSGRISRGRHRLARYKILHEDSEKHIVQYELLVNLDPKLTNLVEIGWKGVHFRQQACVIIL